MRRVSSSAGLADGRITSLTISLRLAPMVCAASICAMGTRRTSSATISTIWKKVPMKMISTLEPSSMPTQSITSGMKATAGI